MYNSSKYLEETVMCAVNQTYKNLEIIIQDDCSKDNSLEIAKKIAKTENRIKIFANKENLGMCRNWNSLFEKANGDYILKLDADDLIDKDFVTILVNRALISDADITSSAFQMLFTETKTTRNIQIHNKLKEGVIENLLSTIIFNNPFSLVFSLIKKEFVEKTKGINGYFMETEVGDAEWLIRSALNDGKLYFVSQTLGFYRIHDSNSSHTPLKQTRSFYFDVLPYYHLRLKKTKSFNYNKKLNIDTLNYIKELIKLRAPLDLKLLMQMIKLRF